MVSVFSPLWGGCPKGRRGGTIRSDTLCPFLSLPVTGAYRGFRNDPGAPARQRSRAPSLHHLPSIANFAQRSQFASSRPANSRTMAAGDSIRADPARPI